MSDGLKKAYERYQGLLESHGVHVAINLSEYNFNELSKFDQLKHIRWMVDTMLAEPLAEGKQNRWLGFIQCALIMHGYTSIQKERDATRDWFKDES